MYTRVAAAQTAHHVAKALGKRSPRPLAYRLGNGGELGF